MSSPTLESYATVEPVGRVSYLYADDPPRPMLWHESANNAFYITVDALNRLQQIDSIGGNPYVIPAVGLWFLAAESYVSTLYKIADRDAQIRGIAPPTQTNKIVEKFTVTDQYFGGTVPNQSLKLRLQDFATLRNAVFHDLTTVRDPEFRHTMFPTRVENMNEAHLMEAVIVSIEVFRYTRGLFPNADLMPSIHIGYAFEKLDVLADEIIFPLYSAILELKGLRTDLSMRPSSLESHARASLPLRIAVRYEGPLVPRSSAGSAPLSTALLERAIGARPLDDDKFELANYVSRTRSST